MKRLVVLGSILATVCAATAATTYYWTGAADVGNAKCAFFTAGNWAKADGSVATAAPVKGDTIVFTNDTVLTLSATQELPSFIWRFEGKGDVLGPGRDEGSKVGYNFDTGASVQATGGGTYKLDYSVNLKKNMGDFLVDVAEGSTMGLSTYGTTTVNSGARLVKRGPGTEQHDRLFPSAGCVIRLEEGHLSISRGGGTGNTGTNVIFEIAGSGAKKLGVDDGNLVIPNYVETEDALETLSFYINKANDYSVLMKGTATVTRCSADIYNQNGNGSHQLVWNPDGTTTLDLVKRLHNHGNGKLYVKSGKMRFAENAGIKTLGELRIGTGTELEVLKSTTNLFRGCKIVVENGGTFRIDGDVNESWSASAPSGSDVVMSKGEWNGLIDVCGTRRLYLYGDGNKPTFGPTAALRLSGNGTRRVNVYGGAVNVTLSAYSEAPETEGQGVFTCYTSSANTLTLKAAEDTRFTSLIYNTAMGTFELVWDPVDTTKTLTVAKRNYSQTRSRFRVKGGTMRLAENMRLSASNGQVSVDAGARLALGADAITALDGMPVILADETAKIVLEGQNTSIGTLTVGGVSYTNGVYTSNMVPWLEGPGYLRISRVSTEGETVTAEWTGGGETASVLDPANWGGTLPDFTNCSVVATFPSGVKTAFVPANEFVRIKGLVVNDPGFTLAGEAGSLLQIGSEGLVVPAAGMATTCTIDCPLYLTRAQNWAVGENVTLELTENASLASIPISGGVVLTQEGLVTYRGRGDCVMATVDIASGRANVYGTNAFGDAGNLLTVSGSSLLCLCGCSLASDIHLKVSNQATSLYAEDGVNYLYGQVEYDDPNVAVYSCNNRAELHFCGGIKRSNATGVGNNGASFSPQSGYRVWIEGKPVQLEKTMLGFNGNKADVVNTEFHVTVASNSFYRGLILRHNKSPKNTLYTEVPYAFALDGLTGVSFADDATKSSWDLCGCDQQANIVFSRCLGAKVTSEHPATLHLVDDALNYRKPSERDNGNMEWSIQGTASQVDHSTFTGAASFSKEGVLKHYMMGESTSTGGVYVAKGELVFTKAATGKVTLPQTTAITGPEKDGYAFTPLTGSWRNASEAVVTGGTLTLEHGQVFGKVTDVKVSGDGVVNLAAGVVQKCHTLTIGETTYDSGTWGGPESDAEHKDAHFAGTGVLRVVGEGLGLILFFR